MKKKEKNIKLNDELFKKMNSEYKECLFFDIETTGLSPKSAYIYMIGLAYLDNTNLKIMQLLCENASDEEIVLKEFKLLLDKYNTVITYNGNSFDISFIEKRANKFNIEVSFKERIDLYRDIVKFKNIFMLSDYKQKTVEGFFDICRDDKMSGKELIKLYLLYEKSPSQELEELLLLHNYDDVCNLTKLICIKDYINIFEGKFKSYDVINESHLNENDILAEKLVLSINLEYPVPKDLSLNINNDFIKIIGDKVIISLEIYNKTLLYFFEDYKNYYYLPMEDYAIHKSVASYVDKDFRQQANASNCYTHVNGKFINCYFRGDNKVFFEKYNDKFSYLLYNEELFEAKDIICKKYVSQFVMKMFEEISVKKSR